MPAVFDLEQAMALLELEAPFDARDVQLARRRMAKRWHPDVAPPGKQHEHQRHLQAINDMADELERLAEGSRGGKISRNAARASAAAARKAREEEGRRAYEAEQRARAAAAERKQHDPFGSRVPDHSVVHRYARCLSYPEWGVGSVTGIYFTGDGDDVRQWARVLFSQGIRTVPAGSLSFVDFSTPDPASDRVERFMTAAQHALAEGNYALAAQRLIYARDADPTNVPVLRMMTLAFWQADNLEAAARAVRDWARVDGERPAAHRFAARIYEDMGAIDLAAEAAARAAERAPEDGMRVGAAGAAAAAPDGPRRRDRGAAARGRARADRRGAARPGARAAARRRHRRGGLGVRAGGRARPRVSASPGRAWRTRWRAPTASASASPPASGRSSSAPTARCATCSRGCASASGASCRRR